MSIPSSLTAGLTYANVTQCALVLEDNPVEGDSRLEFESFPADGFEEAYAVNGYREIAAARMSQPGFVAYRGGNWSAFSLELKFRAGNQLNRQIALAELATQDLEGVLRNMERKARWCQALQFPLEREATSFTDRITANARLAGFSESDLNEANLGQLKRNDPPFVLVVFGSFLTLRCYVTGSSIKWEGPFHPVTVQPYGAVVTLQLQRLEQEYPTWKSIRNSAGGSPQTPGPAIAGNVVLAIAASRQVSGNRAAASGGAEVAARQSDPGADPGQFLALGRS